MAISKLIWVVVLVLVGVVALAGGGYLYGESRQKKLNNESEQNGNQQTATSKTCLGDECLNVDQLEYPAGSLPADVLSAVNQALDDEYKAYTVYEATMEKLGSIRPFSMIIRAEENHIAQLKSILDKYGETIITNPYSGKILAEESKQAACKTGVEAEIANVSLYQDQLIPVVTQYPDITKVFTSLMEASRDKHLPAFEKCD